ncbi:hypothetical protein [Paenibacillus marinisediminis]
MNFTLILERIRENLDLIIRTVLVAGVPILLLYWLGHRVFPISKVFKPVRLKGYFSYAVAVKKTKRDSRWTRHLILLLRSISGGQEQDDHLLQRFINVTVGVFMMTYIGYGFWISVSSGDYKWSNLLDRWALIISLMASFIPYCVMRLKLHRIRVKNSYDLVPAVNTLLLKYTEYRGNLYYAVFETSKGLQGDILNAFMGLLPALQGSASTTIEDAVELFMYRIKTTWSIQLGILIHKSEDQGDNIEMGLRWLIADMSEVAKITEEIKSENREIIQMAYFPAFLLPAVIYLNQYPSMGKSWHYYFQTTMGIRMIIFTLLFTLICALVAYMIQKPRNEV